MRRLLLVCLLLTACEASTIKDAKLFINAGELNKAQELLELELKVHPRNKDAALLLGKVMLLQERPKAAQEAFDRALLVDTDAKEDVAETYLAAAQELFAPNRMDAMEHLLDRATTYDPDIRKKITPWAVRVAKERSTTERTLDPTFLLSIAAHYDPDGRKEIAATASVIAERYTEKGFGKEALAYAYLTGTTDATRLQQAADAILAAAERIPQEELRGMHQEIEKIAQWNPRWKNEERYFWLFMNALDTREIWEEYQKRFPSGAHIAKVRERLGIEPSAPPTTPVSAFNVMAPSTSLDVTSTSVDAQRSVAAVDLVFDDAKSNVHVMNNTQRARGVDGEGWHFIGIGSAGDPHLSTTLANVNDWQGGTIMCFVKLTDTTRRIHQTLMQLRQSGGWGHIWIGLQPGGFFTMQVGTGTGAVEALSTPVQAQRWYHVAGTWDKRTNTARLYVDGKLANAVSVPQWGPVSNELYVGSGFNGYGISGDVDVARVYNRVLTPAEIMFAAKDPEYNIDQ